MAKGFTLPTRQLVSQQDAGLIEQAHTPRSRFHGSWSRKTAFDAGQLIPILIEEVLPGDHLKYDVTAYVRMQTPLFPLLDNQRIDTFFFFVPNRLLWDNWVKFMGEQDSPADSTAFTLPQVPAPATSPTWNNSIWDHMGLPQIPVSINVNALPFRAYNLIWNEWFRDQNLNTPTTRHRNDGPDVAASYAIKRRAKAHDYFTSALPWPQKFGAVSMAIAGQAPVSGIGLAAAVGGASVDSPLLRETNSVANTTYTGGNYRVTSTASSVYIKANSPGGATPAIPQVFADLSATAGMDINAMRQAFMIQALQERDARGGTRYTELLKSHFGVTNPDFRLQRPEYIGGGQTPLQITPVAQTAPSENGVVGQLGGAATAAGSHRASFAATEHGYIIGLINVRSDISYQQGLHRMWSRLTRYDFYWPALAGLGEQVIYRKELYSNGVQLDDNQAFGYQERHHEYRTRYSEVTGAMRTTAGKNLEVWHLAQHFATAPVLGAAFIEDTPPMDRVLAAGLQATGQQYLADIFFRRTAVRPVPMYGTPISLGRF